MIIPSTRNVEYDELADFKQHYSVVTWFAQTRVKLNRYNEIIGRLSRYLNVFYIVWKTFRHENIIIIIVIKARYVTLLIVYIIFRITVIMARIR